jgi:glycyl-tRNA synthetase beta chain
VPAETVVQLQDFFLTRLAGHLVEVMGCVPEVVRAILPVRGHDPTDALAWAEALAGYREQNDFLLLATGFKRCKNILEGKVLQGRALKECPSRWRRGGEGALGESFADLTEPAEIALRDQAAAAIAHLKEAEQQGDYESVFAQLSRFGPSIDQFFDTVRVNVPEKEKQDLRHAFLREIHGLFAHYADFSEIAPREDGAAPPP